MNYKKIYDSIINKRIIVQYDGYNERHHIIPKSLGGTDDKKNLVMLSAREHFLCHYLLTKIYKKDTFDWYKMFCAFMMMKCHSLTHKGRYFNSRLYDSLKSKRSSIMSLLQKGECNSNYGKMWISNIDLQCNKLIYKNDIIPEGWVVGRSVWKKHDKEVKRNLKKETQYENAKFYWNQFHSGDYKSLKEYSKTVEITQQSLYCLFKNHFQNMFINEDNSKSGFRSNKSFLV